MMKCSISAMINFFSSSSSSRSVPFPPAAYMAVLGLRSACMRACVCGILLTCRPSVCYSWRASVQSPAACSRDPSSASLSITRLLFQALLTALKLWWATGPFGMTCCWHATEAKCMKTTNWIRVFHECTEINIRWISGSLSGGLCFFFTMTPSGHVFFVFFLYVFYKS